MRYLHTMVRVSDLDSALDFYCAKLGLKEVRRMDHEKGHYTLVFLATPEDAAKAGQDCPMVELTAILVISPFKSRTSTRFAKN